MVIAEFHSHQGPVTGDCLTKHFCAHFTGGATEAEKSEVTRSHWLSPANSDLVRYG